MSPMSTSPPVTTRRTPAALARPSRAVTTSSAAFSRTTLTRIVSLITFMFPGQASSPGWTFTARSRRSSAATASLDRRLQIGDRGGGCWSSLRSARRIDARIAAAARGRRGLRGGHPSRHRMPTVKVTVAMTVPTIHRHQPGLEACELRAHAGDVGRQVGVEVRDLGPHSARPARNWSKVTCLPCSRPSWSGLAMTSAWSRATPLAASYWATASVSNIEGSLPRGRQKRNQPRRAVYSGPAARSIPVGLRRVHGDGERVTRPVTGAGHTRPMAQPTIPIPIGSNYRLSRAEFERAVEAGAFEADAEFELLDGDLRARTAEGRQHAVAVELVAECLAEVFGGPEFRVRTNRPLALDDSEPDIAVVTDALRYHREGTPRGSRFWSSRYSTSRSTTTAPSRAACTRGGVSPSTGSAPSPTLASSSNASQGPDHAASGHSPCRAGPSIPQATIRKLPASRNTRGLPAAPPLRDPATRCVSTEHPTAGRPPTTSRATRPIDDRKPAAPQRRRPIARLAADRSSANLP